MQATQVIETIVCVCRAVHIPVALVVLGLTASLIPTFRQLDNNCVGNIEGIGCHRIGETLGALRFTIGTAVLSLVDLSVGLAAHHVARIPDWLVLTLDSLTAGFYIGSGSSLAARLNGEFCATGPSDPHFACRRLFVDMGICFVGAVLGYALVVCFWASKARRCRSCSAEVDDGHRMEDPFQDPVNASSESAPPSLNKRRSWSQPS